MCSPAEQDDAWRVDPGARLFRVTASRSLPDSNAALRASAPVCFTGSTPTVSARS